MIRKAFTRAAEPGELSGIDFLEAILRERPDLRGQKVSSPGQGGCGHIVSIGNEIFKGPQRIRDQAGIDKFDRECRLLRQLEGKGLPVPRVTCVGREFLFFGMTPMPGVVPGENFCDRLTPDQQRALAKDVVGFIVDMALALPPQNGKFAVHNDLHYENILIDPVTKRLSAVIDFGLVAYRSKEEFPSCVRLTKDAHFNKMCKEEFALRQAELPGPGDAEYPARTAHGPGARP